MNRLLALQMPSLCFFLLTGCLALAAGAAPDEKKLSFNFNPGRVINGFTLVKRETAYGAGKTFGFLDKASADEKDPRSFAVDLAEGNYDVSVRFGSDSAATSTTIKVEARRLVFNQVETKPSEFVTKTFTVNIRRPEINAKDRTKLNGREMGPPMSPSWDEHLTLEFNGERPGVASIQIKPNPTAITIFLAGDSTVTDQLNEPWAGWGQMLPHFFKQGIAVSNHAESGLALFSFERQRRLEKVLSMMKKGDYLFIQFGHNDQKDKSEGAGPFTTYKKNLTRYVQAARDKGGMPVLVTPMERRRWEDGKATTSLADYAEAVRQVGEEAKAPVIDLHSMSLELYGALGEKESIKAFVFYPADTFPGQSEALKDNTHHSAYGGYELSRCVVEGIKTKLPDLAKHLNEEASIFDPGKPDDPAKVIIPASPLRGDNKKPAGN